MGGHDRAARRRREREQRKPGALVLEGPIRDGRVCTLRINLCHPDSQAMLEIEAIIDTGATHSAISPAVQQNLKLPVVDQIDCYTANGKARSDVVLGKIIFPVTSISRVSTFSVAEMHASDMMLFGMDLIAGGVLTVDVVRHVWKWNLQSVTTV